MMMKLAVKKTEFSYIHIYFCLISLIFWSEANFTSQNCSFRGVQYEGSNDKPLKVGRLHNLGVRD